MEQLKIIDTTPDTIQNYGMCGYKNPKQEGYKRKVEWIRARFKEGLRYKMLYSDSQGAVGGIEYIPGQFAWRPVEAPGYLFIHCLFIIPKEFKNQGYGTKLLETCMNDARQENRAGVAVVTRQGTWMAGKELFIKNGFKAVDTAPPDFELLVFKLDKQAADPKFKTGWEERLQKFDKGLTIITSDQCPYTYKAITEIGETAEKEFKTKPDIIVLKTAQEAQNSPCAFGSFCIVFEGKVIAEHPISNSRFKNIMKTILE